MVNKVTIHSDGKGFNQFSLPTRFFPPTCKECYSEIKPQQKVYYCTQSDDLYCTVECLLAGCYPRVDHDDWIGVVKKE